jgi:predicted Zn-dependent protease
VIADSPAAKAGLQAGDVLVSINGRALKHGPEASNVDIEPRADRARVHKLLYEQLSAGPAELLVHRSGATRLVALDAPKGCPARVRLGRDDRPTAVANGGEVVVSTGLLREVRNDDELAVVIAHETAHITLRHAERLRAEGVPTGMLRELGRNAVRVLASEIEADRLGIKLGWAAGYDMNAAIPFWRRFYARHDGPRLSRTHPSLKQRERIIREALAELQSGPQRPELGKGALEQR